MVIRAVEMAVSQRQGETPVILHSVRIPANVTGHSGHRDRFAHGHHAGVGFVL